MSTFERRIDVLHAAVASVKIQPNSKFQNDLTVCSAQHDNDVGGDSDDYVMMMMMMMMMMIVMSNLGSSLFHQELLLPFLVPNTFQGNTFWKLELKSLLLSQL